MWLRGWSRSARRARRSGPSASRCLRQTVSLPARRSHPCSSPAGQWPRGGSQYPFERPSISKSGSSARRIARSRKINASLPEMARSSSSSAALSRKHLHLSGVHARLSSPRSARQAERARRKKHFPAARAWDNSGGDAPRFHLAAGSCRPAVMASLTVTVSSAEARPPQPSPVVVFPSAGHAAF